jgi:hypothetical protein
MGAERKIEVYRASGAPRLMESGAMSLTPMTEAQQAGLMSMVQEGYAEGEEVHVLTDLPGFSLTHAWLKRDYPLLLHSHDSDCLYYVIAGQLRLGAETLGPRDSFFVPAGAAYTYTPGEEGVEVLEFRHEGRFEFKNLTKNEAFYQKGCELVRNNIAGWRKASPPSGPR